jgi:probable HAF family extracellular repeat protein
MSWSKSLTTVLGRVAARGKGSAARLVLERLEGRCLPSTYSLTYLGTLGGTFSWAYGINNAGEVIGKADVVPSNHAHAFRYRGGAMTDLGTLGGDESEADAINNHGDVVGSADTTPGRFSRHAFLYHDGAMTDLNGLGATYSFAYGINDAGQVVGDLVYDTGQQEIYHAFLYQNGIMIDLGTPGGDYSEAYGINSTGQVAGASSFGPGVTHAFLNSGGAFMDLGTLPGGQFSQAYGLNDAGQVVGWGDTGGSYGRHAFLYQAGLMTDLGTLGGDFSLASHINTAGQVVGWSYLDSQDVRLHGYLYSAGVMTDLNHLISPHSVYAIDVADGINDQGAIVGTGQRGPFAGYYALLLTPNPHRPPQPQPVPDPLPVQPRQPPALPPNSGEVLTEWPPALVLSEAEMSAGQRERPAPVVARSPRFVRETHLDRLAALANPLSEVEEGPEPRP